ncbi:hypothetical protein [Paraburkholderia dinghuensis]|uniref:Uncharacterized protein n=1 Tax=Paraburkholderia dinghuensis TaxID=2305225 RepID=A0A3N6N9X2_9BURK|nr:hypothetical protein [Paraburkholderia dinghuensis]RQH05792.1 hypothetical protein D1Y85_14365 [Paraburkholderia dinghuensis]
MANNMLDAVAWMRIHDETVKTVAGMGWSGIGFVYDELSVLSALFLVGLDNSGWKLCINSSSSALRHPHLPPSRNMANTPKASAFAYARISGDVTI